MSCSVAVCSSPVFSPSSSLFCTKTSIISPSPEALNLSLTHFKASSFSPASPSTSSPSMTFRIRLQKPPTRSLLSTSASAPSPSFISSSTASLGPGSVSLILKRKRPARLDILVVTTTVCFGVPATPCEVGREVERGDDYLVYCKRGRREAIEDRFSASVEFPKDSKQAVFGVFDGHGGAKAVEFAAQKLEKNIIDEVVRRRDVSKQKEVVKEGYLKTDAEFLKEDVSGGTCCVTALIRNGNLIVSNTDDCHAVMSRDGVAEALKYKS